MSHPELDRLSPLPKKIDLFGQVRIAPDALALTGDRSDPSLARALDELADFIESLGAQRPALGPCDHATTTIRFASQDDAQVRQAFDAAFFEDASGYVGHQSYRITTSEEARQIIVQALADEGAYWGMKTLKQLIRFDQGMLCLPHMRIVDGADLEQRGIWMQPFGMPTLDYDSLDDAITQYKHRIDWMSDHKMNLLEVVVAGENGGLGFHSQAHREFEVPDVADRQAMLIELSQYGKRRGVDVVPIFTHPDHFGFVSEKYPELKCENVLNYFGHEMRVGANFFEPETAEIYLELAQEVMALLKPSTLCFWLSECRLHSLLPQDQQGQSEFLQEAKVYYQVVEQLRQTYPDLQIKILLSQGSYPENGGLIASLPKDVQWIFYTGERFGTYNLRPRNPIPRNIAQAAGQGHWISLCNAIRGRPARPMVLESLQQKIQQAVAAGFRGLDGMSYCVPADTMSLFVCAEYAWHSAGRELAQTLRAYAVDQHVQDPASQTQAYQLYDQANFNQALYNTIGIGQPLGNFSRYACMLQRIADNDKVDEIIMRMVDDMETDEIPTLAQAADDLGKALALCDPQADKLFALRCRYLLHDVRTCLHIARAFYINAREKSRDTYKGPWEDYQAAIAEHLNAIAGEVRQSEPAYAQLMAMENWPMSNKRDPDPLMGVAQVAGQIDVAKVTSAWS